MTRLLPAPVSALILAISAVAGCGREGPSRPEGGSGESDALVIAAAASLSQVLPPLLAEFHEQSGARVTAAYAGSGELVAQVRNGAPFDAVFLAGRTALAPLLEADLVADATELLRNQLVLVAPGDGPVRSGRVLAEIWPALAGERVGIGSDGVPAGDYARQWMAHSGVEPDTVLLVPLPNVRAVVSGVQAGAFAAAFVYETDVAAVREELRALAAAPLEATGEIAYPFAILRSSGRADAARRLRDHLASRSEVFTAAGFQPLSPSSPPHGER